MFFNHNTLPLLVDCFVESVINYSFEVWGLLKAPTCNIEKLQLDLKGKLVMKQFVVN